MCVCECAVHERETAITQLSAFSFKSPSSRASCLKGNKEYLGKEKRKQEYPKPLFGRERSTVCVCKSLVSMTCRLTEWPSPWSLGVWNIHVYMCLHVSCAGRIWLKYYSLSCHLSKIFWANSAMELVFSWRKHSFRDYSSAYMYVCIYSMCVLYCAFTHSSFLSPQLQVKQSLLH